MDRESNGGGWSPTDLEAATQRFIPLLRAACRDVGEAAITLGAVVRLCEMRTAKSTFASVNTIAEAACLPPRTARRHIKTLVAQGWLESHGRELLGSSRYRRRRTNTLELTQRVKQYREPFNVLPCWAVAQLDTWAERALYAAVLSRQLLLVAVEERGIGDASGRDEMSTRELMHETGLSERTIRLAKRRLQAGQWIEIENGEFGAADRITLSGKMVPVDWLTRYSKEGAKVATVSAATKPQVSRGQTAAGESGHDPRQSWPASPANLAATPGKSGRALYSEPLAKPLTTTNGHNNGDCRGGNAVAALGADHWIVFDDAAGQRLWSVLQAGGIRATTMDTKESLLGACKLVAGGAISEMAFHDSIAAVQKAKSRPAYPALYFLTSLRNYLRENERKSLDDLLKRPMRARHDERLNQRPDGGQARDLVHDVAAALRVKAE